MFEIKQASRTQVKLKIGFFGPSGSGKTYSALRFAKGLVGDYKKIAVVDTENGSASLYSHLGEFLHLDFRPPFDPRRYIEAIKLIEKQHPEVECIVIDSISHEWEGEGGCLMIQEKLGGRFQDWAKVTPLHTAFLNAILQSRCHIVVCGRTKIDYSVGKDNTNKTKVEKLGTKAVTREGFDYELTLAFRIDENHNASVDKDRTNLFRDMVPTMITEEFGESIKKWNEMVEKAPQPTEIVGPAFNDLLKAFKGLDARKAKYAKTKYGVALTQAKNGEIKGDELAGLIDAIYDIGNRPHEELELEGGDVPW